MYKKLIIISVLLLATVLRFYRLGDYPALNADEAAIGYNAKSLLETGADEHGNPWPVHFQSFNDFKPGLYFYLVLPFVKLLGLNEWAVRLPNALLGVMTVYVVYLLSRELFRKYSKSFGYLPYLAALFLAMSPWHIHYSRGGWEVNTATFFITLGVYLLLKSREKPIYLLLSCVAMVMSLYTYHSARLVAPLLTLFIGFIYRKDLLKQKRYILLTAAALIIMLIPLGMDLMKPGVSSRAAGVGLFADEGPVNRINEQRGEHIIFDGRDSKYFHNKLTNYSLAFLQNWAAHYHGLFLFLSGDDIERDKVPETGQMYLFDILFIAAGIYAIFKRPRKSSKATLGWLFIAPVAAALTFQSPHALRAENMAVPLVIISALGASQLIKYIEKYSLFIRKTFYIIISLLIVWNFARYQDMYWNHMSKEYPFSSQYGVKELSDYIKNDETDKKIVITTKYDQPYILMLFYLNYPPEKFQREHTITDKDNYGFSTVPGFGRFIFKEFDWEKDKLDYPGSLLIGAPDEIPDEANITTRIYGKNNYEYFKIVTN